MNQFENLPEKVFVSSLLYESVGKTSAMIDKFSSWLLAGFAAAITFLISNLSTISSKVSSHYLQYSIYLFLVVLILSIIQKYLATVVISASAGATLGRELGNKIVENGIKLNFAVVFSEAENAVLPPMRYFIRKSFQKASAGNITATARTFTIITQVQGLLALLQTAVIFYAAIIIANNIVF